MTIVKFAAAAAITIAGMYPYASLAAGATELPPPLKPETTDVATLAPGIAHNQWRGTKHPIVCMC